LPLGKCDQAHRVWFRCKATRALPQSHPQSQVQIRLDAIHDICQIAPMRAPWLEARLSFVIRGACDTRPLLNSICFYTSSSGRSLYQAPGSLRSIAVLSRSCWTAFTRFASDAALRCGSGHRTRDPTVFSYVPRWPEVVLAPLSICRSWSSLVLSRSASF
jgi:hypothetical protein